MSQPEQIWPSLFADSCSAMDKDGTQRQQCDRRNLARHTQRRADLMLDGRSLTGGCIRNCYIHDSHAFGTKDDQSRFFV